MERGRAILPGAVTGDLKQDGTAAASMTKITAHQSGIVVALGIRCAEAIKIISATADADVAALRTAGTYAVYDAGMWELPVVGTFSDTLYIEAFDAASDTTNGLSYWKIEGREQ